MSFCKTLVLLCSAAATFAAPATDAAGAAGYAALKPSVDFDATAFDGVWYPVLHQGQVLGCPKFDISLDTEAGTANIKAFERSDDVSTEEPERDMTHRFKDNTVSGAGLKDEDVTVTATFLGADTDYKKWAAFMQHVEGKGHNFNALIVYSRKAELSEEDRKEAKEEIRAVFEKVSLEHSLSLLELNC